MFFNLKTKLLDDELNQ